MIPCPCCDREFEKRAGLMRHVTSSHPSEGAVPTNPGGAIEPVVPVNPEAYPPVDDKPAEPWRPGLVDGIYENALVEGFHMRSESQAPATITATPVRIAMDDGPELEAAVDGPTRQQLTLIRALIRQGRTETEAWMTVVGHEPPPRPAQPVDGRPLRLQQVAFRVRNTEIDQIDASWLLRLAEIGAQAVAWLEAGMQTMDGEPAESVKPIIERWNEAIA